MLGTIGDAPPAPERPVAVASRHTRSATPEGGAAAALPTGRVAAILTSRDKGNGAMRKTVGFDPPRARGLPRDGRVAGPPVGPRAGEEDAPRRRHDHPPHGERSGAPDRPRGPGQGRQPLGGRRRGLRLPRSSSSTPSRAWCRTPTARPPTASTTPTRTSGSSPPAPTASPPTGSPPWPSTTRSTSVSAAEPHEGLVNKFPFDVEQKTYPFWDGARGPRRRRDLLRARRTSTGSPRTSSVVSLVDEPAEISSGVSGTVLRRQDDVDRPGHRVDHRPVRGPDPQARRRHDRPGPRAELHRRHHRRERRGRQGEQLPARARRRRPARPGHPRPPGPGRRRLPRLRRSARGGRAADAARRARVNA